jgi:MFS family permease
MKIASGAQQFFRGLFQTQKQLSAREVRKGIRLVVVDGVCSMAMGTLLGGPFLAAFALALGASNYEIGLVAAIGFLSQPMQLIGLYLVKKFRKRRALNAICAGVSRLLGVFIIVIPVLFVKRGVSFLIQWLVLSALIGAIPGPAWNSLLRDIIPPKVLGRVFSRRMILGTALALVLTLLGGYFVDWWKVSFPDVALYAYSMLFLLGLLFGLVGAFAGSQLPEPTMRMEEDAPILDLLTMPVKDGNFRQLLVYIATWNFAINMATPFFVIYMLKRIELSLFMVTVLLTVSQLTNLLFLRIWGRLADRYSNKSVLSVAGPLLLVAILMWSFTTLPERYFLTIPLLFLIHILSGMSLAGVALASTNIGLKLSPQGYAHAYLTVFGLAGAVTGGLAPLLGGVIADFFAFRELSLSLAWSSPARHVSIYALHFKALDFLFLIAFLVGLYSLHRLARVTEAGEVTESEVVEELVDEVVLPFRTISSIEGIRRLTFLPVSKLLSKVSGAHEEAIGEYGGEASRR